MKSGASRRTVQFVAPVLALCLLGACAKSAASGSDSSPGPATGVTIEKTYTLLNASPFETSSGANIANRLHADLHALRPDSGQSVCPGDAGVHYTITITSGSREMDKVTVIYGGCRMVLMGGKAYSGSGAAGDQFWKDLFAALGPQGQPGEHVSNCPRPRSRLPGSRAASSDVRVHVQRDGRRRAV